MFLIPWRSSGKSDKTKSGWRECNSYRKHKAKSIFYSPTDRFSGIIALRKPEVTQAQEGIAYNHYSSKICQRKNRRGTLRNREFSGNPTNFIWQGSPWAKTWIVLWKDSAGWTSAPRWNARFRLCAVLCDKHVYRFFPGRTGNNRGHYTSWRVDKLLFHRMDLSPLG